MKSAYFSGVNHQQGAIQPYWQMATLGVAIGQCFRKCLNPPHEQYEFFSFHPLFISPAEEIWSEEASEISFEEEEEEERPEIEVGRFNEILIGLDWPWRHNVVLLDPGIRA